MKFWKSKAMLLAVLGAMLLVMAAVWLCLYHAREQKDPDGTLVRQEFSMPETEMWKFSGGCVEDGIPDLWYFKEVAA